MIVLHELERGAIRLQMLECDCGHADCSTVFIIGQVAPKPYWATVAMVPERLVGENVQQILQAEGLLTLVNMIALVGVTRDKLIDDRGACYRQFDTWMSIPDWMARVPPETVWGVRRVVFGDDFTRTIRALKALDRAVPELDEGPVGAPSMEVLIGRQVRVSYERKLGGS